MFTLYCIPHAYPNGPGGGNPGVSHAANHCHPPKSRTTNPKMTHIIFALPFATFAV